MKIAVLGMLLLGVMAQAESLEQGFKNPPHSAKPYTWWHWLDGNVTREGITADLEAMTQIGLGGLYLFNAGRGMPDGPARFLGPVWQELLDHTMTECSRLDLEFGLHNCDGFSQSGGPWMTPETSMKELTWTVKEVEGPIGLNERLIEPDKKRNFYRDIAVIAFPVPQGEVLTGPGTDTVMSGTTTTEELAKLVDGDPETFAKFPASSAGHVITFEFSKPRTVRSLMCGVMQSKYEFKMEVSDDGENFRQVGAFTSRWSFQFSKQITAACEGAAGKFFRITIPHRSAFSMSEIKLSETERLHFVEAKSGRLTSGGHGGERVHYEEFPGPDRGRTMQPDLVIDRSSVQNTSDKMTADGRLTWDVPPGKWRIMRVGYTTTGRTVVPSTKEGKGLECDKFDAAAVRFHLDQYIGKIKKRAASKALMSLETDSWHCAVQNWTEGFEDRFRARLDYDLIQFMPTLLEGWIIDNADVSERVLWDWRRFLSDQVAENYWATVHAYAEEKGLTYVSEPTGRVQFNYDVSAARHCDIPMGEFWRGKPSDGLRVDNKVVSSFAHITGRTIVASEAYTSWPQAAWNGHPFSMKMLGDSAFCAGVNRFIFHTFMHQPYEVTGPGFTFGPWGVNFNRNNTWWKQSAAWMDYLTRCNYMLSTGTPVCDVLYYAGDDVPNYIGWRDELHPALPEGYDFDGCDALAILEARVENGRIVLPSGMQYRVLLLPNLPTIRPAVLRKVQELVAAGAVVIGPRPNQSPSLQDLGVGDRAVQAMAEALWGGDSPRIFSGISFEELFKRINLPPDFDVLEKNNVIYVHRRTDDAEIYFVSNQENRSMDITASFRVGHGAPEWWDPSTGETRDLLGFSVEKGLVRVPLHLDPGGSGFVVFCDDRSPAAVKNWPEFRTTQTISNPWQVTFPPKLGAPEKAGFNELISWPEHSNPGIRFFSGTATYQTSFNYQKPAAEDHQSSVYLDLGKVAVIAEVELNGKNLGVLWKPPFRVPVDGAIKEGKNELVVKVTNLWRNRMIGDEALPQNDVVWRYVHGMENPAEWPEWLMQGKPRPSGRVTFCTRKDVYSADDTLVESGLLGPVTLQVPKVVGVR